MKKRGGFHRKIEYSLKKPKWSMVITCTYGMNISATNTRYLQRFHSNVNVGLHLIRIVASGLDLIVRRDHTSNKVTRCEMGGQHQISWVK